MKINLLFFIFLLVIVSSCKKAEDRSCFKSKGKEISREISVDQDIDSLKLYDNLFYTLIQGDEAKIVLSGGENLLSHIEILADDGTLSIRNNNKCNFLRSYKNKIHALIYVDSIRFIYYEGAKELKSEGTLSSNELRLVITDGAGDVDLTLKNGYTSAVVTHGFGNFTLRGETLTAFLSCNTNSYCDTRSFITTGALFVNSNTVGNMRINANTDYLEATIQQRGNVEYIGDPNTKIVKGEGKGKLIDLNN